MLNQQTYSEFKAYAEQQYRDNRQAVRSSRIMDEFITEVLLARRISSSIARTALSTIYGASLSTTITRSTTSNGKIDAKNILKIPFVL